MILWCPLNMGSFTCCITPAVSVAASNLNLRNPNQMSDLVQPTEPPTTPLDICPFCGREAALAWEDGGSQFGKCGSCGAEGPKARRREWKSGEPFKFVRWECMADAIEKWNRRCIKRERQIHVQNQETSAQAGPLHQEAPDIGASGEGEEGCVHNSVPPP